jgi:hypothetical protein
VVEEISIVTLDEEILHLPAPDFIKIDVEGWKSKCFEGPAVRWS